MVSMLFWNVNRKPNQDFVANLAKRQEIDVLMLVECLIEPGVLLTSLNSFGEPTYFFAPGHCEKIKIYTKFSEEYIKPIFENDRLTIRHLELPAKKDILLAVTHFPSKLYWNNASQYQECQNLAAYIEAAEHEIGHSRTILVGDLNMNPFEDGIVGTKGLHSVMSRKIAMKRHRVVLGRSYSFFYNPMWSLLGDGTRGPPGTYFYTRPEHVVLFWNIFDQVLVRPDLLDRFKNEDLNILDSDGDEKFLSKSGLPKRNISDHLPISFKLNI
ncbi:MAG: hypothetical protein PHS80_00660 [Methanothrix sp.]|nr:hypothetical protein [Methanothrix sp.]MDD4448298.1 hypothetical protein [Methanothrix sp.]